MVGRLKKSPLGARVADLGTGDVITGKQRRERARSIASRASGSEIRDRLGIRTERPENKEQ